QRQKQHPLHQQPLQHRQQRQKQHQVHQPPPLQRRKQHRLHQPPKQHPLLLPHRQQR
ncbi:unnamed protein product, partial [Adineta steineri]